MTSIEKEKKCLFLILNLLIPFQLNYFVYYIDDQKSPADKKREEDLINLISKLVHEKDRLTTDLDQIRLR